MILISCGTFQNSDKPLSENERLENVFGEFKIHYQRLLTFKNTSDFKVKGFGGSGLITEWPDKVNKLNESPDSKLLLKKNIDVGDLKRLGLAYAGSNGAETETTKRINNIFAKAIIAGHVGNEEINLDDVNHNRNESIVELFSQFPNENLLYPNGIKDNPVIHPYQETYIDSAVHPKSLTGLNRVYSYVSAPTYLIFPAKQENNRGIGLIIFPGGGFKNIWIDKEGTDIALWLSEQGISCMVVKYRTNRKDSDGDWLVDYGDYKGAIYEDARTSMQIMREFADSLNFDKSKIGMMGFSAGGWLTERMVYKYYNGDYDWNPKFVALIYHGNSIKLIKDVKDKEKLPPFFMAVAKNDNKLTFENVLPYLKMVSTEVKNSELHIYPDGGHGFGLAYDETSEVSGWKIDFVKWLDRMYK
jgi:dienelactone hydrolase